MITSECMTTIWCRKQYIVVICSYMTTANRKMPCPDRKETRRSKWWSSFVKRGGGDTESSGNGCITCIQYLKIKHVLDAMHCEKNFCENIIKTIWGVKDTGKFDWIWRKLKSDRSCMPLIEVQVGNGCSHEPRTC